MGKRRRATRGPASSNLTASVKKYTLRRGGEGSPKGSRRAAPLLRPLMSRLRRLEILLLQLYGKLDLAPEIEQKMLDNVKELVDTDPEADGRKGRDKEV